MNQFILDRWKDFVLALMLIIIVGFGVYEYNKHESVPMATVISTTPSGLSPALNQLKIPPNVLTPQVLANKIAEREKTAPDVVYITKTQSEADKIANKEAKKDNADAIIKKTDTNPTTDAITNKYYGVHTERLNKIKVGVTVVDSKLYEDIAYQHNKDEVIVHYAAGTGKVGVTYMRTIVEW